jgi:EAL domain-containing protein (putative c-di-GMP-specific phosphodiesterase class I)
MDKKEDIKVQRDRFLAFSFASADLFMEVDESDQIVFALGAARSITGINETKLLNQHWLDFFDKKDKATLKTMQKKAEAVRRCGPFLVTLDKKLGGGKQAIVTGIKMPDNNKFYVTIGFTNVLMAKIAKQNTKSTNTELLDKDTFLTAAREALDLARSLGQDIDMTLLDIENPARLKDQLGEDAWNSFSAAITSLLNSNSLDGEAAAQITDGRYSVIHDSAIDSEFLTEQIIELSKEADPEGEGFEIKGKKVTADLQSLSERETTKALIYTINEFERKGTSLTIDNLNSGFKAYVSANAQKISEFKSMVEHLNFNLHFQPIIDFENLEATHYEMLSRFDGEGTTEEWVIFGEDIGMAAEFDIAVCDRAINYLLYKSQGRATKFAINLSGQSLQNEQFFLTLNAKLQLHKDLSTRMIFEVTESHLITDLEMVNHFIGILQKDGYKVCLDDFGAGSASFQYLHKLHVDYVKIDGQYTQKVLSSERDAVMIKNLSQMCKDLNVKMVAERIETEEEAMWMKANGVQYGQGFLFAQPKPTPDYMPSLNLKKKLT